jgi:peptidoglycan/xylan/chitin deacetylase (PgdA/CDA1 family)
MTARFILSLDCEGKWGVADHLRPSHHVSLCDDRLGDAYRAILAVLEEFGIPATFAFVGCFSMSERMLRKARPELEELAQSCPDYLTPAIDDIWSGSGEGWIGDWAYEAVATATPKHEIGLHGATHVPWDSPCVNEAVARRELGLLSQLGAPVAAAKTYVFPRNGIAHTGVLADFGIVGYRNGRRFGNRAISLLSEFDLWARPDEDTAVEPQPMKIPAGYFINWISGVRRLVPIGVSARRARLLLERADRCDGVVHYWTHPENIASSPKTIDLFRTILELVARMRDEGSCEVLTQVQYCTARI